MLLEKVASKLEKQAQEYFFEKLADDIVADFIKKADERKKRSIITPLLIGSLLGTGLAGTTYFLGHQDPELLKETLRIAIGKKLEELAEKLQGDRNPVYEPANTSPQLGETPAEPRTQAARTPAAKQPQNVVHTQSGPVIANTQVDISRDLVGLVRDHHSRFMSY
ncbi:MAG: hypothetical protein QXE80_08815 [Pyrobaculum sp.]